jgi:ankyrin repeat protein
MNFGFCLIASNTLGMLTAAKKITPKRIRLIHIEPNDSIKNHAAPNPYDKTNLYNAKDADGDTLLHIAVSLYDHSSLKDPIKSEILEQILKRNPNPFIQNQNSYTPLEEAKLLQDRGNFSAAEAVKKLTEYEQWYYSTFSSDTKE